LKPEKEWEFFICSEPVHPDCAERDNTEYDMDFFYCPNLNCLDIQLNPSARFL